MLEVVSTSSQAWEQRRRRRDLCWIVLKLPRCAFVLKYLIIIHVLIYCHFCIQPKVSSKELNPSIREGKVFDKDDPPAPQKANIPGGPGSQWRMMRLRRVYETAEEENKPVEEIAEDRFGSLEAFEEAKEERRILDEREGKRSERGRAPDRKGRDGEGAKGFMFTDVAGSGASSRSSSFRRPGAAAGPSTPSTPSPQSGVPPPQNRRLDSLRLPSQAASPLAQSHTPIPTVMTPVSSKTSRALSPSSLNRLQAKVLRAKLMGAPDAETLEREYDEAVRNTSGAGASEDGVRKKVEVLPTLDAHGRMYDVGHGQDDGEALPGNRKKKEKVCCSPTNGVINPLTCCRFIILSSRLAIQRLATLFDTMRMTIRQLWERCFGKSASVLVWLIKKILMPNLRRLSWAMENSK